jgi:dTDP-4-amino-4,6-dideoxygalactose transaminase
MIRLADPRMGLAERAAATRVLRSGYLVQGPEVERFERLVADYVQVRHAVAVSSGTAALHAALFALGIGAGDEVVTPAYTFPATNNVVEIVGGTTLLVDIVPSTFCIDPQRVLSALTKRTRAVVVVHEFGYSADLHTIQDELKRRNIYLIEDAACALGTEYAGKKVGGFGDVGCFSLHPRKAITTGEGGILVTDSDEIAEIARSIRNHGLARTSHGLVTELVGLNYRMTNFQGAIGVAQMGRLGRNIDRRIELAAVYADTLDNLDGVILPKVAHNCKHVFQTYHVMLSDRYNRQAVISALKERGIETNIGAYAIHEQPYYARKYGYTPEQFKYASAAYHHGLALPLHDRLTKKQIRYVASTMRKVLLESSRV